MFFEVKPEVCADSNEDGMPAPRGKFSAAVFKFADKPLLVTNCDSIARSICGRACKLSDCTLCGGLTIEGTKAGPECEVYTGAG